MVDSGTTITAPQEVRTTELSTLGRLVTAAREGRSATVRVTGELGAGKTRLLGGLAARAGRLGVSVGRGVSTGLESAPYLALAQALRTIAEPLGAVPGAAPGLPDALRRLGEPPADGTAPPTPTTVRRLLAACVSASPGGLLLLLDDFHCADRATIGLFDLLVRQPVPGGLILVTAYRPWQAPAMLRSVARLGIELGTAEELPLAPLTLEQSAALLDAPAAAPRTLHLHRLAQGNPLFLTALADAPTTAPGTVAAPTPHQGLRDRLLAEIAPLGRRTQVAARAAAVLGEVFDVDSVAAVADLPRSDACRALGELRGHDLVRPAAQAGRLVFRHPLLRDCLVADGDDCWWAEAHRRALDHLAAAGASPLELAGHVVDSGPRMTPADRPLLEAGIRAALGAGRIAQAGAWTVAALRLRRAGGGGADHGGCGVWQPVVQALAADGRIGHLDAVQDEVLLVLGAAPIADRVSAMVWLAGVQASLGRIEESRKLLSAALAEVGDRPDLRAVIQVQMQLGQVLGGQLPPRAEVDALVRETAGADPVTAGGCLSLRGLCTLFSGDLAAAVEALDAGARLLDSAEPHGPAAIGYASFLTVLASAESALGRYAAAGAHTERALAEVRLRGDHHLLPVLLNVQAYVAYQSGRMAEALEAARQAGDGARAAARADQALLADALTAAAWAWLDGDTPADPSPADAPAPHHPDVVVPRATVAAMLFAEAALAAGDGATALDLLLPTRGRRVQEPAAVLAARVYELLTSAALALGEPAERWALRAEAAADAVGLDEQTGYARLARGHLHAAHDQPQEAVRSYREARCLLGDSAAGVRAEELALVTAGTAGHGRPGRLESLTSREREVAELAGEGLKTRDIAHLLTLSPRTVDVHLARIYRKVGVSSRAGLVRLMAAPPGLSSRPAPGRAAGRR
ncbi:LuxR C-terminal-related transcriptional regulator [Kitasatospora sp. NPDC006697]|uniref:LuxR C-terminal-related transcriptional regulator n=1 Tax=Kitasatospora sp. NPDC006697 TaxID=3364020 RepID=UPI00368706FE